MALSQFSTYNIMIAILLHLPQFQASYLVKKEDSLSYSRCYTHITISGHGIDEMFTVSCPAGAQTDVLFRSGDVLIGDHRKNDVSLFIDKADRSQVMIYGPEKICQSKSVMGRDGKIRFNHHLPTSKCDAVKQRIADEWDAKEADSSDKSVNIIKTETQTNGKCTGTFTIIGNGIKHVIENIDCLMLRRMYVIFIPEGVIVDDYQRTGEALYTESPSTLIRVHKDSCYGMTFCKGQLKQDTKRLESGACTKARRIVDDRIANYKFTIYRYSYYKEDQCMQDITVYGRGVIGTLSLLCDTAPKLQVKYKQSFGTLVLGDYRRDKYSAYTDTPGVLVILQDVGKDCTKYAYEEGSMLPQAILTADECVVVKQRAEKALKEEGPNDAKEFTITRMRRYKAQDGCKQVIKFQGNGVDDIATVSCETAERMVLRFVPNGFILCDYEENQICFMMDSSGALIQVLKNSSCKLLTYEGGEIKTKDTTQEQCNSARNKIQKYREKNLIE